MDLLNGILKKIMSSRAELKVGLEEAKILDLWPVSVGEQIAKHAKAFQLKGSTLMVSVDHPIWKQELHANKMLALQKFNQQLNEALGKPDGRAEWITDMFLMSPNPISENPSKGSSKFRKK